MDRNEITDPNYCCANALNGVTLKKNNKKKEA